MGEERRVALGDLAKDMVTGYEGIAIARTEWLNGCVRITLQAEGLTKDGKTHDNQSFDEEQVKVVKTQKVVPRRFEYPKAPLRQTGGPHPEPKRGSNTPRR